MHRAVLVGLMLLPLASFARAGTLHGTVTLPPESRGEGGHWRVENGILPIGPRVPDPRTDVVVVLEGGPDTDPTHTTITAELHDLRVDPRVIVAPLDATVQFKNGDRMQHTLYIEHGGGSLMPPAPTAAGKTRAVRFFAAGEYPIRDQDFLHIRATVLVLASPFYSRVGEHGDYRVQAPDGHYTLKVYSPAGWVLSRPVDLGPKTPELDLQVRPGPPKGHE